MKKILLIIALIFLMALNVFAQTGSYTSHDIFYLPLYGAYGTDEYDQYNTYMEIADQLIWDNKTAIEAIEADYLVAADLTGYYTKLEIDAFPSFVDWSVSQAPTVIHADNYTDNDTTYTAGTGLDLTGTVFSLDASAFDLSDFPADPNADRYLFWNDTTGALTWAEGSGSGVTTFVGLTDTPLNYTGYAGYFPKVNAGATALEFAELTEGDISDFGTYLTDITGESIGDLSDVDLTDIADTKILQYNATTSKWECETAPAGGGASELSDLSDVNTSTPTNRYVLVADGVDFESRLLVEADISDLGTYLENITAESILDLTDTPVAFDSGKFLKSGADAVTFASITETDITDLGSYIENVVEDTTPQLGGDLDMSGKNIQMDSTLTADHSYSGITDVVTVGESVVFADVLYFKSDGEWYKANAAGEGTYPGLVIALESKGDGQACKVLRMGYIRDDSWSWTLGQILLLGETAGALTATVPSDTGDMVQRLGYAIHADKIYFMPSIDVGEI